MAHADHSPLTVAGAASLLHARWDPALAEDWDRVGLVCGDPQAPVRRVLFAVDPTLAVAEQAVGMGADLLVTHHPLLLRGVSSIAASTAKGAVLHRLVRGDCALLSAHTNADAAAGGVNDALADLLGLQDRRPLVPASLGLSRLVVYVPADHRSAVADAMFEAGAGRLGEYDRCAFHSSGTGQFRPSAAAAPFLGRAGQVEVVPEDRVEVVLPTGAAEQVVAAMRAAHPYEEPAFSVVPSTATSAVAGIGRVGRLVDPATLADLVDRIHEALPATAAGVRAAGDPRRMVRTVALCSGAGDSLLGAARASGADVYVTADLRHHPVDEHLAAGGCPVVDLSHWASEWPWLSRAAREIERDATESGRTVEARVSDLVTDPWTLHRGGRHQSVAE